MDTAPPPLPDVSRLPPLPSTAIPHLPPSPRPNRSPLPSTTDGSGDKDFDEFYDDVSLKVSNNIMCWVSKIL